MSHSILMVDDDPNVLKIYSVLLKRKGFEVFSAMDGTVALEILETTKPDLVILDVMMPGIDGIELCSRIRSDPQTAQTPIIFLSARGDTETIQMALTSGGDEYLVKPLLPQDLVDKVFVLLGQPA